MRFQARDQAHGPHTLKVWRGVVVGMHAGEVFVELGPRMQGVIAARDLPRPAQEGHEYDFTLRGKEESLWALSLAPTEVDPDWAEMEPGTIVPVRVLRVVEGGLQVKIGLLHAFLPRSQTGLPRTGDAATLVGKVLTCEVLEVDHERQRVIVSRKLVLRRERDGEVQRKIERLQPGRLVQGRVSRIESYGAFVSLGEGLEGMIHVSNLSHERVEDPSTVLKIGETVETKVLHVRRGGRRIGLGLKQVGESPWIALERDCYEGQLLAGRVTRLAPFGAFIAVRGLEGLLPNSEVGSGRPARECLNVGREITVRILTMDAAAERLSLSLTHAGGGPIHPDELRAADDFEHLQKGSVENGNLATNLGQLLRRALG